MDFEFYNPTRVIFGWDALKKSGHRIANVGNKPLIVTGKGSVQRLGYLDTLLRKLEEKGMSYELFTGVEPNPRSTTVDRGARLAEEKGCDFVLALGGGSTMDAAKGVAIAAFTGGSIWDHIYDGENKPTPVPGALPVVTVPTIAATGSEFDYISVITNWEKHVKNSIYTDHIYPTLSIIDPSLTCSLPDRVLGEGGVDIICHVLEPYFNSPVKSYLVQRGFVEASVRAVVDNLPTALRDKQDQESRMNISWASSLALSKFIASGFGGGYWMHAIEHVISAHYDIAHGRGLAAVLPAYMKFVSKEQPLPFHQLAKTVFGVKEGSKEEVIAKGIRRLESWMEEVGMLTRLSDHGVDHSNLDIMAKEVITLKANGEKHLAGFKSLDEEGIWTIMADCL